MLGVGRGAGSFLLSPSPLESLTEKKQAKESWKCLQSTLPTVPLTLWMPNRHIRSRSLPVLRGAQGWWLRQHRSASHGFFGLVFFFDTIPAASIRAHLPGACFPGGFASCPLPGSSCSAGSWGKRLSLLGEVLARWEMLALTPCPPRCTLRPNFPFFPSLGLAEGRQGMLPWPQGLQDLSHGCADSGPLALPMWESPLEILEMPTLP